MTFLIDYAVSVGTAWWFVAVTILFAIVQAVLLIILFVRGSQPTPVIPWLWLVVIFLITIVVAQGFAAYKLWSQTPRSDDPKLVVARGAIQEMATTADSYAKAPGPDESLFESWIDDTFESLREYLGLERAKLFAEFVAADYPDDLGPGNLEKAVAAHFTRCAVWLRKLADDITVDDLDTFYRYGNN